MGNASKKMIQANKLNFSEGDIFPPSSKYEIVEAKQKRIEATCSEVDSQLKLASQNYKEGYIGNAKEIYVA